MAYKKNYLDEENQVGGQTTGSIGGGQILAGNSGSGPTPQAKGAGSGWTNLSTYLDMNQGQTGGIADTYAGANQEIVGKAIGSDLVKNTQADQQWTKPIADANALTDQVKTGDLAKIDASQYKNIQNSNYQKPQNYGQLGGYQDVLSNFSKAAERVDNIDDYGTQQSTLRDKFSKDYKGYNSGMGTLDTFLLRGDKDASAKTAAFKAANQDYGSLKNPDGTPAGTSKRFNSDVTGVLDNFFNGQDASFKTAKQGMNTAVGQRRAGIETTANKAFTADPSTSAEIMDKVNKFKNMARFDLPEELRSDMDLVKTKGTRDAADYTSEADWDALSRLEGLDGVRSDIQNQERGDYSKWFDQAEVDRRVASANATKAAAAEAKAIAAKVAEDKRKADAQAKADAEYEKTVNQPVENPQTVSAPNSKATDTVVTLAGRQLAKIFGW